MSVVDFPLRSIGRGDYPPRRVVVAPDPVDPGCWITWILGQKGPVVLERAGQDSAFADAAAFAERHGLTVQRQDAPLLHAHRTASNGIVTVEPSGRDGGSWDIVHDDRVIANRFNLAEAERFAREKARELEAEFLL